MVQNLKKVKVNPFAFLGGLFSKLILQMMPEIGQQFSFFFFLGANGTVNFIHLLNHL